MTSAAKGRTIAYVGCSHAKLKEPHGAPFLRARFDSQQSEALVEHLAQCTNGENRQWFLLTWTEDDPTRFRLFRGKTPDYETRAAALYARGDAFRISGRKSLNIDFSGQVGAALLAERLACARSRMRRFVEIRVPSRKRNLIEFLADTDIEAVQTQEHDKLALVGETLAAELLPDDDFSDWDSGNG